MSPALTVNVSNEPIIN